MKRILKLDRLRLRGLSGVLDEVLLVAHVAAGHICDCTSIRQKLRQPMR
jgi:hypothetical protein